MPKRVFLAAEDLVFRSKLAAVVGAAGAELTRDETACDIAVVDLERPAAEASIRTLAAHGVQVIAYGSHRRADRLRAARAAGALAVPNSEIERRLAALLTEKK